MMVMVPRLDDRARGDAGLHVVAVGERGERHLRADQEQRRQGEQPVEAADLRIGKDDLRQHDHDAGAYGRKGETEQQRVADDMRGRPVPLRQLRRDAAPQSEGRERGHQLDDHDRVGEAPERFRAVELPGDEQERHAREQAQQEADEIGAAALRQRLRIGPPCIVGRGKGVHGAHGAGLWRGGERGAMRRAGVSVLTARS